MFAVSLIAGWVVTTLPAFSQAPVVVTNTTAHPVPVVAQGTTNVAGTVNIGNMPGINIANTPSVTVAGVPTITNVLDSQNNPKPLAVLEAEQPYEDGCAISFSSPNNSGTCHFQPIPAGKRLVIEEVDIYGYNDTGIKPVQLAVNPAGYMNHNLATTFLATAWGHDSFATHQPTRLYAGPTAQPACGITVSAPPNIATYFCGLSGYLVDTQ